MKGLYAGMRKGYQEGPMAEGTRRSGKPGALITNKSYLLNALHPSTLRHSSALNQL